MTGCGKVGTFQIYYEQNGFGVGLGNTSKPRYTGAFSTLTTNTAICPRFASAMLSSPTTLCCIGTDCALNNYLYNFTNIPCSLDDNLTALLICIGGAGMYVIRKRMTNLN